MPLVSTAEMATELERLRALLREERDRLRPDSLDLAWALVRRAEGLLPAWDDLAAVRGADALALHGLMTGALTRSLGAFLALPDTEKPAHADELLAQLQRIDTRAKRATTRLTAVLSARLRAQGELL